MLTRPRWALAALLAIIGVSFAFVAVHVESYTRLSPIDELSHLDYMFRSPAVLAPGDKVEQQAMYEQACRGVDAPGFDPVLCDRDHEYDADIYQEHGFNTAATNTPIYYTATRAVAEVVRALTPTGSLFVAGRLSSGIWLALGLALVYLAGRRAGIRPAPLLAVLALLPASPAILYPSATVTPDAMGLVAGALVVLAALAWERRPDRVRTAVLVLVCVLVPLIKLTNIVAVAALVFYLAFNRHRQAASERRSDEDATDSPDGPDEARPIPARQRWTTGAVAGVAAVVAGGAWTVISNSRNHADPDDVPDMAVRFAVTEFPWNGLLDSALIMAQPLSQPWVGVGTPSLLFFTTTVVSLVLIAGTAAAAFFSTGTPRATVAARAMLAAAVLVALGLVTMGYVTASQYFPLPARYGVALVPGMVLVTAGMLRTRSSVAITAGLAVVVLVFTAARVIGLPLSLATPAVNYHPRVSDQPKSDADLLRESELFDVEFYLRKNPDVRTSGIDPVLHYLRQGARDGRDPSKAFSTNAYLRRNDDVGQMNPLVHYLRVGKPAGRALNPLEDDLRLVRESGFFDEDYYRHFKPDLPAERDAVRHYLRFGRRDGLDPSEKFSTSGYLRQNPDVARTTWNPLVHYLRHGRTEGRIAPRGALREPYFDALYADRWAQIAPMPVTKVAGGSHRITIVTDSVAPHSLFGGVGTAIILGVEIANRLGASLRLVTRTDAPDGQVISLLQEATGIRLEGVLELDQVSTDGTQRLQFTDRDIVMTTSWWTTRSVLDSDIPREQVLYLLQEDERMFYAFGDERLLCSETLAEPDLAVVVNTSRLLSHLVADGLPHLRAQAVALEPAFPGEVATTPAGSGDGRRNFFFYSRPHNARNLFWRGGQVIARAVESRLLDPDEWRFHFVGRGTPDLTLPRDVQVEVVEGLSWTDYQAFVRTMDAALVLMDTPHPSYPPYDLASVGAAVLTNSHGIKTDLSDISDNIIVAPSTVDGLLAGLERLVALARDPQQRAANVAADHIGRDWAAATAPVVDWVVDRFGAVVGPRQDDGLHVL